MTSVAKWCFLYRHFDVNHILLYVGISEKLTGRTSDHVAGSTWARFIHHVSVDQHGYPNRALALHAERYAIQTEKPLFNKQHVNYDQQPTVDYLLRHLDRVIQKQDTGPVTIRDEYCRCHTINYAYCLCSEYFGERCMCPELPDQCVCHDDEASGISKQICQANHAAIAWDSHKLVPTWNEFGRIAYLPPEKIRRQNERWEDIRYECPCCGKPCIYSRELDRFIHDDGSDNDACWLETRRGCPNTARVGEAIC